MAMTFEEIRVELGNRVNEKAEFKLGYEAAINKLPRHIGTVFSAANTFFLEGWVEGLFDRIKLIPA